VVRKRAPLDTARSALDSAAAPKTLATYITLWHYAIDPLILAVSAKTWAGLSLEDRTTLRKILRCVEIATRSRRAPVSADVVIVIHLALNDLRATLTSASDSRVCRGAIHKRGLHRAPAPIPRPSEEPSNAQSEHVQHRIGTRLRAGSSNAKTEHEVSRAFLPGKVLTFYPHRKAPLRPTLWNAVTPSWFPFICTDCIQKRITRLLMLCAMRLSSHRR
jgi:hypothetical protein